MQAARECERAVALFEQAESACIDRAETITARAELDVVQGTIDEALAATSSGARRVEALERALARFDAAKGWLETIDADPLYAKLQAMRLRRIEELEARVNEALVDAGR